MASYEHYRLALQQMTLYQQQMEEYLRLSAEVKSLHEKVAKRQKKHRRCDRDIAKNHQVACS